MAVKLKKATTDKTPSNVADLEAAIDSILAAPETLCTREQMLAFARQSATAPIDQIDTVRSPFVFLMPGVTGSRSVKAGTTRDTFFLRLLNREPEYLRSYLFFRGLLVPPSGWIEEIKSTPAMVVSFTAVKFAQDRYDSDFRETETAIDQLKKMDPKEAKRSMTKDVLDSAAAYVCIMERWRQIHTLLHAVSRRIKMSRTDGTQALIDYIKKDGIGGRFRSFFQQQFTVSDQELRNVYSLKSENSKDSIYSLLGIADNKHRKQVQAYLKDRDKRLAHFSKDLKDYRLAVSNVSRPSLLEASNRAKTFRQAKYDLVVNTHSSLLPPTDLLDLVLTNTKLIEVLKTRRCATSKHVPYANHWYAISATLNCIDASYRVYANDISLTRLKGAYEAGGKKATPPLVQQWMNDERYIFSRNQDALSPFDYLSALVNSHMIDIWEAQTFDAETFEPLTAKAQQEIKRLAFERAQDQMLMEIERGIVLIYQTGNAPVVVAPHSNGSSIKRIPYKSKDMPLQVRSLSDTSSSPMSRDAITEWPPLSDERISFIETHLPFVSTVSQEHALFKVVNPVQVSIDIDTNPKKDKDTYFLIGYDRLLSNRQPAIMIADDLQKMGAAHARKPETLIDFMLARAVAYEPEQLALLKKARVFHDAITGPGFLDRLEDRLAQSGRDFQSWFEDPKDNLVNPDLTFRTWTNKWFRQNHQVVFPETIPSADAEMYTLFERMLDSGSTSSKNKNVKKTSKPAATTRYTHIYKALSDIYYATFKVRGGLTSRDISLDEDDLDYDEGQTVSALGETIEEGSDAYERLQASEDNDTVKDDKPGMPRAWLASWCAGVNSVQNEEPADTVLNHLTAQIYEWPEMANIVASYKRGIAAIKKNRMEVLWFENMMLQGWDFDLHLRLDRLNNDPNFPWSVIKIPNDDAQGGGSTDRAARLAGDPVGKARKASKSALALCWPKNSPDPSIIVTSARGSRTRVDVWDHIVNHLRSLDEQTQRSLEKQKEFLITQSALTFSHELENIQEQMAEYQSLAEQMTSIGFKINKTIRTLNEGMLTFDDRGLAILDQLRQMRGIKGIRFQESDVVLVTEDIYMNDVNTTSVFADVKKSRYLGQFEIRLNIGILLQSRMPVEFGLRNIAVPKSVGASASYGGHPHRGCTGTFRTEVVKAANAGRMVEAITLVLNFLSTFNPNEGGRESNFKAMPRTKPAAQDLTQSNWFSL